MTDANKELLRLVRERNTKQTEFNGGILTADSYTKTLQQCVGSDLCYRYASKGNVSFDDLQKKAASTLTYNNPDMGVKDIYGQDIVGVDGLDLPKNTLMVFRHILTTPRQDRDGDILRTAGARPDPKMLLLWQHVHTLPIGKALGIAQHNPKSLEMYTAIVDLNELAHDAAVMVDNDMGRFSHGFRALSFVNMKEEGGRTTGKGGFDVKEFEIMEESLVSVPSNVDADVTEIMLDLIEGDKLTSSMMKAFGVKIRSTRPERVSGGLPEHLRGEKHADCGCGKKPADCDCEGKPKSGTSEKADDAPDDEGSESETDDTEVSKMICPKCGAKMLTGGQCQECGHEDGKPDKPTEEKKSFDGEEKAGRTISAATGGKLAEVHDDLKELHGHVSTRSGKALCEKCIGSVKGLMDAPESPKTSGKILTKEFTAAEAAATFLEKSTTEEKNRLFSVLSVIADVEKVEKSTNSYRVLLGHN